MKPTKQQLDASLRDAYKLKATGPSPTADLEQYVAVIAQAVIDNEAWDRVFVVKALRDWADVVDAIRGEYRTWTDDLVSAAIRAQADLMEGKTD